MDDTVVRGWFAFQFILLLAFFLLGRIAGRRGERAVEVSLLVAVAMAGVWAIRGEILDALVLLLPLDVLVYGEGAIALPALVFVAGAISAWPDAGRLRRLAPLVMVFSLVYFAHNAQWMVRAQADASARVVERTGAGPCVVRQSSDETCVAAALATALRAPELGVMVSEADMAGLALVRKGAGATMLRAHRALQQALVHSRYEPRLFVVGADEAARMASPELPVLVSLHTSSASRHMVVLFGRLPDGSLLVGNPWADSKLGDPVGAGPNAPIAIKREHFAALYAGRAIAFARKPRSGV